VLVNYHIGRLVLSSLCVGDFGAAGFMWCSFCRLKHNLCFSLQNEHQLLMMDILMSETCWAH